MRDLIALAVISIVSFWVLLLAASQLVAPAPSDPPQRIPCAESWSYEPERQPEQLCQVDLRRRSWLMRTVSTTPMPEAQP